jgi:hypothetical protein
MAYYNIICKWGDKICKYAVKGEGRLYNVRGELRRFGTREEAQYEADVLNWMYSNTPDDKKITHTVREERKPAIYDEGWT